MKFPQWIKRLGFDLLFLSGCTAFVYGLACAWRPLGFIAGGLVAAAIAFFVEYRPADRAESGE